MGYGESKQKNCLVQIFTNRRATRFSLQPETRLAPGPSESKKTITHIPIFEKTMLEIFAEWGGFDSLGLVQRG
jgi:hypothetical protein